MPKKKTIDQNAEHLAELDSQYEQVMGYVDAHKEHTGITIESAIMVDRDNQTITPGIHIIGDTGVPIFLGIGELHILAEYAEEALYKIRPNMRRPKLSQQETSNEA